MDDFSELEIELKELRPVQPSEKLATRIERALAEAPASAATAGVLPKTQRVHWNWLTLGAALTAAAVLLLVVRLQFQTSPQKENFASTSPAVVEAAVPAAKRSSHAGDTPAATPGFVPVGVSQVVYNTRDEGLFFADDASQPVRRVRSQTRETLQWRNPSTGASLRVSYPSEEVELIPVSGQ
jgi:hypothetical protein